jgi:hypothetical protein
MRPFPAATATAADPDALGPVPGQGPPPALPQPRLPP